MVAEIGPATRANNRLPKGRAPVPQSSTKTSPVGVVSSTHEVLPPKRMVLGPGEAMDPLVPQKRAIILGSSVLRLSHRQKHAGKVDRQSVIALMVSGAFPSRRLFTKM